MSATELTLERAIKVLEAHGACDSALEWLRGLPEGTTPRAALEQADRGYVVWLVNKFLSDHPAWERYEAERGAAWERYEAEVAPAWERYEAEVAPALERYKAEVAPALERYKAEVAPAWERYEAEVAPAWERYKAERGAAWERYEAEVAPAWERYKAERGAAWEALRSAIMDDLLDVLAAQADAKSEAV